MTFPRLPRVFALGAVAIVAAVAVVDAAMAQDPDPRRNPNQPGRSRRGGGAFGQVTAQQRAKPPLVPWQRNLEDALAMVAQTGKPLLICVNMDGEPASERLAWSSYRDPEFVKRMDGFIPLLVSPDQRNPRDWDDHGRRIPDRRFGRVVNYEHITIEPIVRERYFGDQAVAPRHVGVSKDGTLLFDIYLVRSFDPIVEALEKHGKPGRGKPPSPTKMAEAELLRSHDCACREELEKRFWEGDEATRKRIVQQAISRKRKVQHPEILRMGLLVSPAVRRAAVESIAQHMDRVPEHLWDSAFRACGQDPVLIGKLESAMSRLAQTTKDEDIAKRAANLALVCSGLRGKSSIIDVDGWRKALLAAQLADATSLVEKPIRVDELEQLDNALNELERRARKESTPELRLQTAATTLRYARVRMLQQKDPTFLLEDVRTHARAAAASSNEVIRARALGLLAWASYLLGDTAKATTAARDALPLLLSSGQAGSTLAAQVLDILATSTKNSMFELMNNKSSWVASTRQAHAAYQVLAAHPTCTEQQFLEYLDWLRVIKAYGFQPDVLERALARFPVSGKVHEYLRYQQLRDWGAESLERAYARMKPAVSAAAATQWYSGVASLRAAERHVQNRKNQAAIASYQRAIQNLAASADANKTFADSANHYICQAQAGQARLLADAKRWDVAVQAIQKGLRTRALSAGVADGLGNTPIQNANHVYNALLDAGKGDEAKGFQEAVLKHGVKVEKRQPRGRFGRRRR